MPEISRLNGDSDWIPLHCLQQPVCSPCSLAVFGIARYDDAGDATPTVENVPCRRMSTIKTSAQRYAIVSALPPKACSDWRW